MWQEEEEVEREREREEAAGAVAISDDGKAAKLKFSKTHNGAEQRESSQKGIGD